MPGAIGPAVSAGRGAGSASERPSERSIAARGRPPGRSRTGSPRQATIVELRADRRCAAVDDEVDAAGEVGRDVFRTGRGNMAGTIGGRRHNRFAECREDVPRHFVRGHAYGDGIEPGRRQLGHRTTDSLGQDERQRPRPKVFRQPGRIGVKAREALRFRNIGDMGDERIEAGRPLAS